MDNKEREDFVRECIEKAENEVEYDKKQIAFWEEQLKRSEAKLDLAKTWTKEYQRELTS